MEHAEAREILEVAAVEPGGFGRLAAGDTPEAAWLAGHLAGCPDCAAEMERLQRAAGVIREAVRVLPPADLRDRTLVYVAAVGRPRGARMLAPTAVEQAPVAVAIAARSHPRRLGRTALWVASVAAALTIAVVGTASFVGGSRDARVDRQEQEIAALAKVATWSLRIDGEPDARYVRLESTSGAPHSGTLVFSPGSAEVVVVASGLAEPGPGLEYRCWLEVGGARRRIGPMFFGGDVAYWVGAVDLLKATNDETRFGVSLVPSGGDSVAGDPVLVGTPS